MKIFLKEIKKYRRALKENRTNFWKKNKKNFENNIKRIIKSQKLPRSWKIYIVASNFLSDKKILPFDYDSWSSVNLIAATKKQGFEMMLFLNKARAEFLSIPALAPLVIHELQHAKQAAKNPKKYIAGIINDRISRVSEIDAEKAITDLPKEFREENALESVLYCYDIGGWKMAKKMADFLYKKREEIYGGGYKKGMTEEEYKIFLRAEKNKDINIFINFFG